MSVSKICINCGEKFNSGSNRAIRCGSCQRMHRKYVKRESERKRSSTNNRGLRKKECIGSKKPKLGGKDTYKNNSNSKNWIGDFMTKEDVERENAYFEEDEDGNYIHKDHSIRKERIAEWEARFAYLELQKDETIEQWKKRLNRRKKSNCPE